MDIVLQIVLVLVALSTFFFAYKSWSTWRILDIILVVAIFFASGIFIYVTARAFKAQAQWRNSVRNFEKAIKTQEAENKLLLEGSETADHQRTPGLTELQLAVNRLAIARGEAWFGALPGKVNAESGAVTLTVNAPDPHGIPENAVVYIFTPGKEQNSPASYVGKFKVTAAPDKSKTVEIIPDLPLTPAEIQKISRMPGPWNLHLIMPIDDPDVFASMTEGGRAAFLGPLPQALQDEFGDKKREPLDFEAIFKDLYYRRLAYYDSRLALDNKVARLLVSIEQSKAEMAYRTAELANLDVDKKKFQYELAQIDAYLKQLQEQLKTAKADLKKTIAENRALSAKITAWQLKLAEEINRRAAAAESPVDASASAATGS